MPKKAIPIDPPPVKPTRVFRGVTEVSGALIEFEDLFLAARDFNLFMIKKIKEGADPEHISRLIIHELSIQDSILAELEGLINQELNA